MHHNAMLAWDKKASENYAPGWFVGSEGQDGEHLRDVEAGVTYSVYRKANVPGATDMVLCGGIQMRDDAQELANLLNFR